MSCYLCGNRERLETFRKELKKPEDLRCCPVCGTPIYVLDFIDKMKIEIAEAFQETCTDEDGNILICKGRADVNTTNMGIDLDKINIDREIFIMEQNLGRAEPWMVEYVKQSQK